MKINRLKSLSELHLFINSNNSSNLGKIYTKFIKDHISRGVDMILKGS